jgi:hypothetical protein
MPRFHGLFLTARLNPSFGGKFKSESISYEILPLNSKNQSKMLFIALLLKSVLFFVPICQNESTKEAGHFQRNTFPQFFCLLFRYHQTVEMPVQHFILTRIFYTLLYRAFLSFGANSPFHHFFNVSFIAF